LTAADVVAGGSSTLSKGMANRISSLEAVNSSLRASNGSLHALCKSYVQTISDLHAQEQSEQSKASGKATPVVSIKLPAPNRALSQEGSNQNALLEELKSALMEPTSEVQSLREQNDTLVAQVSAVLQEVDTLREGNLGLTVNVSRMQKEAEAASEELTGRLSKITALEYELAEQTLALEQSATANDTFDSMGRSPSKGTPKRARRHSRSYSAFSLSAFSASSELSEGIAAQDSLREQLRVREGDLAQLKGAHLNLKLSLAKKEDELALQSTAMVHKDVELGGLKGEARKSESELAQLRREVDFAKSELERAGMQLTSVKDINAELLKSFGDKEDNALHTNLRLSTTQTTLAERDGELSQLYKSIKELGKTLKIKEDDITEALNGQHTLLLTIEHMKLERVELQVCFIPISTTSTLALILTHTHTDTHTHTHTHTLTLTHKCTHTHMRAHAHTYVHRHTYTCIHAHRMRWL
jgi:chromosome segregation ATPase